MSAVVEVQPSVLQWVIQKISAEMTQERETLTQWIAGTKLPTASEIQKLSRKIHIPFGYFFMQTPPEEEIFSANRTLGSLPVQNASREFIDVYNQMLNLKDWMSEYARRAGMSALPFSGKFANANAVTRSVRKELSLEADWYKRRKSAAQAFKYLRERISDIGVLVFQNSVVGLNNHRVLSLREFRAFALSDEYAPLIFINSNDTDTGKIFSLIHELAHIWLGEADCIGSYVFDTHSEKICNEVAAEILVPRQIFIVEWGRNNENAQNKIAALAQIFKCSDLVLARRALDFGFIGNELYEQIAKRTEINAEQRPNKPPVNFYNALMSRWDEKIIQALDKSTKSGDMQFLEAYRLTGLKGTTFHKLVKNFRKISQTHCRID